ncbi:MAG: 6-bladed beta-propeller [Tannerella sp.]|jgi:hypothetical protein|nr:6-bladed beta-propeller [Tannerella sp.]
MKRYKLFVQMICAGALALAASGCSRMKETPVRSYTVDFSSVEKIPLTEIASDIRTVRLETDDDILISYIRQVIDVGERLLVRHGERCSLFDKTGKYLRDIGGKGQGPREWVNISGLFVRDDAVFVFDESSHKILVFDFDGLFVREIRMPEKDDYYELMPLHGDDACMLFTPNRSGREKTKFTFLDETGEKATVSYDREYKAKFVQAFYIYEGAVFHYGDRNYFKEMFSDTIFAVHEDYTVSPRLALDFGKYGASLEKRHGLETPQENVFENMVRTSITGESASYLFFNATLHRETSYFYLDKQRHTLHNVSFYLTEEPASEKPFTPGYISEDNRRLIGVMEAEDDENPSLIVATLKQ